MAAAADGSFDLPIPAYFVAAAAVSVVAVASCTSATAALTSCCSVPCLQRDFRVVVVVARTSIVAYAAVVVGVRLQTYSCSCSYLAAIVGLLERLVASVVLLLRIRDLGDQCHRLLH